MPYGILNLALGLAIQVGSPGPSEAPNAPVPARAYGQYGFEGSMEQRHPFDTQQNWVHGYFQEIPAYGGHAVYRPYNYKDVLSQSQTAAGWGERPSMPYSQQYWHKYHDQATMLKLSRAQQGAPSTFMANQQMMPQQMMQQAPVWMPQPNVYPLQGQQVMWPQPVQGQVQNTILIPSSINESVQPPVVQPTSEFNQLNYRR